MLEQFEAGDFTFDVRVGGPADGEPVVLLHGFPQNAGEWDAVSERLNAAGHRTFAPDQRGYSPGARPVHRTSWMPCSAARRAAACTRGRTRWSAVTSVPSTSTATRRIAIRKVPRYHKNQTHFTSPVRVNQAAEIHNFFFFYRSVCAIIAL